MATEITKKLLIAIGDIILGPLFSCLQISTPGSDFLCANRAEDLEYASHFLLIVRSNLFCLWGKKFCKLVFLYELPIDKTESYCLNSVQTILTRDATCFPMSFAQ